ncbi:cytochrome P450 [Amycolatopsis sp. NPDC026612]|uniref:cytochrome P450 n=1 Tax=Amycolatopsis sp. NPDC026612 TaxID=3155466 RepID=UPI0033D49573
MTTTEERVLLASDEPFVRRLCPHLREPYDGPPVRRIVTPAGDHAWLVSRYAEIKGLLRDDRLGRSHPDPGHKPQYAGNPTYDLATAADHGAGDKFHHDLRKVLQPHFAARHMLHLRPKVEELTAGLVEAFAIRPRPADLHAGLSAPLTLLVICELLGVPADEREQCAALVSRMGGVADEQGDGTAAFFGYLRDLAARKRAAPEDDVISRLVTGNDVTDEQVGEIAMLLLFAGIGSTVKQIDYGFLLLANDPAQRDAVAADPDLVPRAVEEMLRVSGSLSLPRYAREDIEIGGVTIGENELVLLDLARANMDVDAFDCPAEFDVGRAPNRHLTFAHGAWACMGAPLARILMQVLFTRLLSRLPGLRPLIPAAKVATTDAPLGGGLTDELLVTW